MTYELESDSCYTHPNYRFYPNWGFPRLYITSTCSIDTACVPIKSLEPLQVHLSLAQDSGGDVSVKSWFWRTPREPPRNYHKSLVSVIRLRVGAIRTS